LLQSADEQDGPDDVTGDPGQQDSLGKPVHGANSASIFAVKDGQFDIELI
jgi:hypothetical protein